MKGQIDSDGRLIIERGKVDRMMVCPFTQNVLSESPSCGDWCPHFGEPRRPQELMFPELAICHGKILVFEVLNDYRKGGQNNGNDEKTNLREI